MNPPDSLLDPQSWCRESIRLPKIGTWPVTWHLFDPEGVWAIRAALVTGRPLLLRGKPGMGKSQLARAAAVKLKVPFLSVVVDERTERDDLLLGYDAVARLAQAQVVGAQAKAEQKWQEGLRERSFVRPGPLWWAFDWGGAADQAKLYSQDGRTCEVPPKPKGWSPGARRVCGPVILVDEIDKADPSVPNGLLETLANDGFQVQQPSVLVRRKESVPPPLVIITTNEERELPPAFLRRCLVHQMVFPEEPDKAEAFLLQRARVHFPETAITDKLCKDVAGQLREDRKKARDQQGHEPGPAEFLDVIRALVGMYPGDEEGQGAAFKKIRRLAFEKHLVEGA